MWQHGPVPDADLNAVERAYLAARDARDRLDVARARGEPVDRAPLEAAAAAAERAVRAALAAHDADTDGAAAEDPGTDEDRRALAAIRHGVAVALTEGAGLPVAPRVPRAACDDADAWAATIAAGGDGLKRRLEACYGAVAAKLEVGGRTLNRFQVLTMLGAEPDRDARRRLFLALEPLWRVVDGDGGPGSPFRAFVRESSARWAAHGSPIAANAEALGVSEAEIGAWVVTVLAGWRAAVVEPGRAAGEPPVEPWDWWWRAGTAQRAVGEALTPDAVRDINRRLYASLGADLDALGVQLDLAARAGRPAVPVAFTTFGARPHRRSDGSWSRGQPTVLATCVDGGLGELSELIHETGHAIHLAAIRTRPAFADWPASDALTEALADLIALDVAEPDWQRRWLPGAAHVPDIVSIRCRHAETVLDAAWALFEIRQHAEPDRVPNETWTEITSTWLGIAAHPEWSWWAMRGQLVQDPGYMANYAMGAVLSAAMRDAIRDVRGPWIDGDPGWYDWVSDRVYRFGLERSPQDVVAGLLGGPPTASALLEQISRGARIR